MPKSNRKCDEQQPRRRNRIRNLVKLNPRTPRPRAQRHHELDLQTPDFQESEPTIEPDSIGLAGPVPETEPVRGQPVPGQRLRD